MNWRDIAALQALHDQDVAAAVKWWREASEGDRGYVWMAIQEMGDSSLTEIISRFAQIGMTEAALRSLQNLGE